VREPDPDLLVTGERVALGPLRRDLAATYARWMNQPDVRFGAEYLAVATAESQEAWVEEVNKAAARNNAGSVWFTVYDLTDRLPVGTTGLSDINHQQGNATFGISLGERRGQGLGGEATRLCLDWAFHVVGLQNVLLEALLSNEAAIRAYEKAGFRRVGVRRGAAMTRGRREDVIVMDAIPSDLPVSVIAP
jgi:RimJ/RimL family protein N-acetyltransferase